jgi:hypothetical protein
VAIFPTGKDWKLGDPPPGKLKLEECAMRTFAERPCQNLQVRRRRHATCGNR